MGRSFTSVRTVLTVLKRQQLIVKKEKCSFGQKQIHYLGHIIGPAGVREDPEKIEAMTTWPQPKYVKELRGFLGLTTGYGNLAKPLTNLLKKNAFTWSEEAETAFHNLKRAVTQAPVLALPDFSIPFLVECDASGTLIGAILMQNRRQSPISVLASKVELCPFPLMKKN